MVVDVFICIRIFEILPATLYWSTIKIEQHYCVSLTYVNWNCFRSCLYCFFLYTISHVIPFEYTTNVCGI